MNDKLDQKYAGFVACWLREITINSLGDPKPYSFSEVADDLQTRAIFGLANYFKDIRLKKQIELNLQNEIDEQGNWDYRAHENIY